MRAAVEMTPSLAMPKDLLGEIATFLGSEGRSVTTCESCTGGLLGVMLTELPGSSRFYRGGLITYATDLKENLLGIPSAVLATHGVVSEPVVRMMAAGCARLLGSHYAIATTGIAGPDGGSPAVPIGTVWCGFHGPLGSAAYRLTLTGTRGENRLQGAREALQQFLTLATTRRI